MPTSIKDGSGSSRQVTVDETKRLHVRSVDESLQNEAAINGESFFAGSGAITLTSDSNSAVFYIKNNEDRDLLVISLTSQSKESANATSALYDVYIHKLPTGLSSATSGAQVNPNLGSNKTLSATLLKGGEGETVTGGTVAANFMLRHGQIEEISSSIVVPKGASFAVSVTPAPGNTSMVYSFSMRCFLMPDVTRS